MQRKPLVVVPTQPSLIQRNEAMELKREHRALERRLEELNGFVYLTPEEQYERKQIQKLKLQKKDALRELTTN